jgi:hypothetical protein
VLRHRGHVLGHVTPGEQARVHARIQRLDAAVEDLRKPGVLGHFGHGHPVFRQQPGRASGGKDPVAESGEALGELDDAGLVGHADQRLRHRPVSLAPMAAAPAIPSLTLRCMST